MEIMQNGCVDCIEKINIYRILKWKPVAVEPLGRSWDANVTSTACLTIQIHFVLMLSGQ
jgi:hypothetical protein